MERDRAIDIAQKFATRFPRIEGNATARENDWAVRVVIPGQLELWAFTDQAARTLWRLVESIPTSPTGR